jgi:regulator of sirC expression with transglutaminase-like and TPR domain
LQRRIAPFAEAVAAPGSSLDELALTLSAALQPGLDLIGALAELDELAAGCPTPTRDGVIHYLFGSGRFVGDRHDYHRWQNSCVDHVVTTRRGMPITLAVVGIEVGRRLGVGLVGVGMPGHFLVGDPSDPTWFADPFEGRSGLDVADCREILERLGVSKWSDRFVEPTSSRMIVARMLNNLKASCQRRGDAIRLAVVMQARQAMPEFAVAEREEAAQALAALN